MLEPWQRRLLAAFLAGAAAACASAGTEQASAEADASRADRKLNERFVDPDLDVDRWVQTFEVESRDVYAARHEVVRATQLRAGGRVADIGAGTGLYTRLFSDAVGPQGRVYAVEISPRFLEHISRWAGDHGAANVTAVFGRTDSTTLPAGSIDVAFVCDTYHHFEEPQKMLASIRDALADGGSLIVVDFERIPGQSREWVLGHVRAGKEVFRKEIEAAGFAFVEEVEIEEFRETYFLRFRKP